MKKTLSLLLILAMLLPTFTACSETTVEEETEATKELEPTNVETAETEEEKEDPFANIPTANLDGMTFTFVTSNWPGEAVWTVDDLSATEYTGAPINDAVYDRNLKVEERLNCHVAELNLPGSGDAENAIKMSVTAGDNAYQVWVPRLQIYLNMAANGFLMDMKNVEGINFENKAWVQNSIEGLSVLNHNFAVCNDMVTIHKEANSSIIFNKSLADQYQFPNLYDVVTDDKWTLDYFGSLVETCASDLNGDGQMTADDQWGFFYQRDTLDAFLAAAHSSICAKDEEDRLVYIFDNEYNINALMKMTDLIYNQNICYNVMNASGDFNVWMTNKFMEDEAMFMWVRNVNIPQLRTMESDFGILPNPKHDETIDKYYSIVNSYTGAAISVPNIVDPMVEQYLGLFLETMGAASLETLATAYYDTMLNGIVARDQASSQMLDIIYANTSYDAGSIGRYGNVHQWIYMAMSYANNFASYNAGIKKSVEKSIEKTLSQIADKYGDA